MLLDGVWLLAKLSFEIIQKLALHFSREKLKVKCCWYICALPDTQPNIWTMKRRQEQQRICLLCSLFMSITFISICVYLQLVTMCLLWFWAGCALAFLFSVHLLFCFTVTCAENCPMWIIDFLLNVGILWSIVDY